MYWAETGNTFNIYLNRQNKEINKLNRLNFCKQFKIYNFTSSYSYIVSSETGEYNSNVTILVEKPYSILYYGKSIYSYPIISLENHECIYLNFRFFNNRSNFGRYSLKGKYAPIFVLGPKEIWVRFFKNNIKANYISGRYFPNTKSFEHYSFLFCNNNENDIKYMVIFGIYGNVTFEFKDISIYKVKK